MTCTMVTNSSKILTSNPKLLMVIGLNSHGVQFFTWTAIEKVPEETVSANFENDHRFIMSFLSRFISFHRIMNTMQCNLIV